MLLFTETIPKFLRPFRKNQVSLIYFLTNENGERERGRGTEGGREGEREGEGEGEGDRQRDRLREKEYIEKKRESIYREYIGRKREYIDRKRERVYREKERERKKNSLKIANFLK